MVPVVSNVVFVAKLAAMPAGDLQFLTANLEAGLLQS